MLCDADLEDACCATLLMPSMWPLSRQAAAKGLKKAKGNELKAIVGKLADAESIIALKVRFSLVRSHC